MGAADTMAGWQHFLCQKRNRRKCYEPGGMIRDQVLPVPAALLGAGDHYALEVSGDSMIEAGIFDGDFALVKRANTARDGEIVVGELSGVGAVRVDSPDPGRGDDQDVGPVGRDEGLRLCLPP